MSILISWAGMILHDWFPNIINRYLELSQSERFLKCYTSYTMNGITDLMYTNVSRYKSYEYELFYKKFDKLIYLIRDPVTAMHTYYFWNGNEYEKEFFKDFIDLHLIEYAEHMKAHRDIADIIIDFERIVNDVNCFIDFIWNLDHNVNIDICKLIHKESQPLPINIDWIPEDKINYIRNKWSELIEE